MMTNDNLTIMCDITPPPEPSRKKKRRREPIPAAQLRLLSDRLKILLGFTEVKELTFKEDTNEDVNIEISIIQLPNIIKKEKTIYTDFHKTIIMILYLFINASEIKYSCNAKLIAIQNLLMLNYNHDESIIRTKYGFPILTVQNINDLVRNEKKRLIKNYDDNDNDNDFLELALVSNLVDLFECLPRSNSDVQVVNIAQIFSEIGFKEVDISYENNKFIFNIQDFQHEEFHQDCPELKECFNNFVELLASEINGVVKVTI